MTATWEIINWSDTYTFEADDIAVAFVVVTLLGRGAYGAREVGG